MQEKQFLQKQKQGNHTESVETEILRRKTISAKNKTEKPNLFCRTATLCKKTNNFFRNKQLRKKQHYAEK